MRVIVYVEVVQNYAESLVSLVLGNYHRSEDPRWWLEEAPCVLVSTVALTRTSKET
jgi:hypothetical protein